VIEKIMSIMRASGGKWLFLIAFSDRPVPWVA